MLKHTELSTEHTCSLIYSKPVLTGEKFGRMSSGFTKEKNLFYFLTGLYLKKTIRFNTSHIPSVFFVLSQFCGTKTLKEAYPVH